MEPKIQKHAEKLQMFFKQMREETLEEMRDEALLLADSIEEYIYQRDAQRLVEEFLEKSKEKPGDNTA
ncbi:MAG: hypothetical protein GY801_37265 [bacterium]|nr:hypothetical protein [bacterium]